MDFLQNFLVENKNSSYNLTGQCDQMARSPMLGIHLTPNVNLEKRLSVNTVLKDLELLKLEPLFEEEEVGYYFAYFGVMRSKIKFIIYFRLICPCCSH